MTTPSTQPARLRAASSSRFGRFARLGARYEALTAAAALLLPVIAFFEAYQ